MELKSELNGVIVNIFVAEKGKIDVGSNFIEIDVDAKGSGAPTQAPQVLK